MGFSKTAGFFSYAHNDDTFDFLSNLRKDICDEYRVITGDELELFFDRESIEWGARWEKSIRDGIDTAGIFMPVLSPCYFASSSCMGELNQYLAKVERSGVNDLILPLFFSDPALGSGSNDSMLERVMSFQYRDISDMRFLERGCGEYRKRLNDLTTSICRAQRALEKAAVREMDAAPGDCEGDRVLCEEPKGESTFLLDAVATFPTKTEEMTESVSLLIRDIDMIGKCFNESAERINEDSDPKEALAVVAGLAKRLDPVSSDFLTNSEQFSSLVAEADPLIRVIMAFRSSNPTQMSDAEEGLGSLVENARTARKGIASLGDVAKDAEKLSRVLYKPLKKIERASAICGNAIDLVVSWGNLVPSIVGNIDASAD